MGGGIRQYFWVIDLVGIFFCAFFLARVTSVYLGKAMEVKRSVGVMKASDAGGVDLARPSLNEYAIVMDRNIFDSSEAPKEGEAAAEGETEEEEAEPTGEAVLTSLNIKVLGVLVVGQGTDDRSSATIVGPSAAPASPVRGRRTRRAAAAGAEVYSVGDEESFAPNTKLVRVQPDRIEFLNGGRLEYAEVMSEDGVDIFGPPQAGPVAEAPTREAPKADTAVRADGGGRYTVDKREVDQALQNLDKLYTEIRAVPNFSGGKVSGMKILSVKNGSIFAKLGLRRGDVLQKINGMELDVRKGFEIFNQLKEETSIRLDLLRQGQPTQLEYEIR